MNGFQSAAVGSQRILSFHRCSEVNPDFTITLKDILCYVIAVMFISRNVVMSSYSLSSWWSSFCVIRKYIIHKNIFLKTSRSKVDDFRQMYFAG